MNPKIKNIIFITAIVLLAGLLVYEGVRTVKDMQAKHDSAVASSVYKQIAAYFVAQGIQCQTITAQVDNTSVNFVNKDCPAQQP